LYKIELFYKHIILSNTMSKYNNYISFLNKNNYEMITLLEDFQTTKKMSFKCKNNHITTLTINTFGNKKSKNPPEDLCTECKIEREKKIRIC